MKIISFNVNGIRAIMQKDFEKDLYRLNPDIICLQETKASEEQVKEALKNIKGYDIYCNEAEKKGYSGTTILSKEKAQHVIKKIGKEEHDNEGRVIALELNHFYLVNVYVPNSGSELARLPYRCTWDMDFLQFIKELEKNKPVIVCGDLNVAHKDIDLKNPKANYNKYAGYMQEEIDGMNNYVANGFVDTFRHFYPNEIKYSWWSYRAGARQKNVGWRIDYFLCSNSIISSVKDAFILNDVLGSDHCPVGIDLE
ncbi:MAG: exodeoxyribonuclease III [Flavobacteriia bacterium]|nr:exodeoxyribonuclease III [Flavobacteriia bacterium]